MHHPAVALFDALLKAVVCEMAVVVCELNTVLSRRADKDIAILYRTKKTGRHFQAELRRLGVPFNVHGVSFWRRKVVASATPSGPPSVCLHQLDFSLACISQVLKEADGMDRDGTRS